MKKSGLIILVAIGLLVLLPFASAGFFDWITGRLNVGTTGANVPLGNTGPLIVFVEENTTASSIEGTYTDVIFTIEAYDHDDAVDLVDGTAWAWLSKVGETTRNASSACSLSATAGKYKNYTCTVKIWYWDAPGVWTVTAAIKDASAAGATNNTQTFTNDDVLAFKMSPDYLYWDTLIPTDTNKLSNNDPTILNNTGNNVPYVDLNATNLAGETYNTYSILATDFKVSGTSTDECSRTALITSDFARINNATAVPITLGRGNVSLADGTGQTNVFYCLTTVNAALIKQNYTTAQNGAWTLKISTT